MDKTFYEIKIQLSQLEDSINKLGLNVKKLDKFLENPKNQNNIEFEKLKTDFEQLVTELNQYRCPSCNRLVINEYMIIKCELCSQQVCDDCYVELWEFNQYETDSIIVYFDSNGKPKREPDVRTECIKKTICKICNI